MKPIRIGTRGSPLALWQANHVSALIQKQFPKADVKIVVIKTTGDKVLDVSLSEIGNKSLFLKEIEDELMSGHVDLAVHSMKDVPAEMPKGLVIAAVLKREDPRDAFVSLTSSSFDSLPAGAIVGTSSLRRIAQLRVRRPDLIYKPLRGNVDTRLRKLKEGQCSAVILAAAGLIRLGFASSITEYLDLIPAVGQGAVGVEIRENDSSMKKIASALNDDKDSVCVHAERAFLKRVGGDCRVPVGCFVELEKSKVTGNFKTFPPKAEERVAEVGGPQNLGNANFGGDRGRAPLCDRRGFEMFCKLQAFVSDCEGKESVYREAESEISVVQESALKLADEILRSGGEKIMRELGRKD